MGQTTIGWTATVTESGEVLPGLSFNPWINCTPKSKGCDSCYARTMNDSRFHWVPKWGAGQPRKRTSASYWRQPLKWARDAVKAGIMRRVFGGSLCDVLDSEVDQSWRDEYFDLIDKTGQIGGLMWLLLTKRHENFHLLPQRWLDNPPPYVRLGVTAENAEWAYKRIPALRTAWKGKAFVSFEPLIGDIGIAAAELWRFDDIHVITGAESGDNARPMNPEWARNIFTYCAVENNRRNRIKQMDSDDPFARSIPFFHKQNGEWITAPEWFAMGGDPEVLAGREYTIEIGAGNGSGVQYFRVGRKLAGDKLGGVQIQQFPEEGRWW